MILGHKLADVDIRGTYVEFGRCFAAGSISGFVLRKSAPVLVTDNLSRGLKRFSACIHSEGPSVCGNYVSSLLATSQEVVDDIPAGSRLTEAISNASIYGVECPNIIRNLSQSASLLLHKSLGTRSSCFRRFGVDASDDIQTYNMRHRDGNSLY